MVYNDRFYSDPLIRSLYRRVADGKATYAEVQTFAQRASVICSEVLMDYAPEADFAEWARELVTPSLTQMHGLIDDVAQQVQTHLNRVAELGIKAQSVPSGRRAHRRHRLRAGGCRGHRTGREPAAENIRKLCPTRRRRGGAAQCRISEQGRAEADDSAHQRRQVLCLVCRGRRNV